MFTNTKTATSRSGLFYGRIAASVLTVAVLSLQGCSVLPSADKVLDESTSAASQSLQYLINGNQDVELTEAQVAELQYASSYVQFDDQARVLAVLGYDDGHSLQWISASEEVLTLSMAGRALRTDSLLSNLEHVGQSEDDPLVCYQQADALEQAQECPNSWQRLVTTEHGGELSQWQVVTTFSVNQQDNIRTVVEEGVATKYDADAEGTPDSTSNNIAINNTFYFAQTNAVYRPFQSEQWVSPQLGYVNYQEVKVYNRFISGEDAATGYDAGGLNTSQVFEQPPELTNNQIWIRLQRSNGTMVDIVAEGEPRITQLLDLVPAQQSVMWPQTKISSPALEQQFAARKQGMYIRLKMLAQTYRHDGKTELAAQAEQLAADFLIWPLAPSYVTNFSRAKARVDLAHNPLLNEAQVGDRLRSQPHYTITLSDTINLAEQPKLPIADTDLPKGFRDVNQQLGLFLQHWSYADTQDKTWH